MKRIIFLLIALTVITGAYAQGTDYCVLKLQLNDSSAIAVRLDGRYINRHTNSLTLDGLRPGSHHLDVYSLEGTGRKRVRIYSGTIQLRAGRVHDGTVDLYHRSLGLHIHPREARDEWGGHVKPNNEDIAPITDNSGPTRPEGLPGSLMNDLQARVDSLATDTEKEALMKKELENRRFTTTELRQMLYWLSFESTRLSFAQWSYGRVEDQDQYPRLEDVFEYNESRKEFQKIFSGDK